MNVLKRLFRSKKTPEASDNVPYYWGTEALNEFNRLLSQQIEETEKYLSTINKPA